MKTITTSDIQNYKKYLFEEEKSKATIEKYIRDIAAFANWLGGRTADKQAVIEYKQSLMAEYAPQSVNSFLSSLNGFFTFKGWLKCKTKFLKIKKSVFKNKEKELTKSEYARLLKTAKNKHNDKLYYLMQTICATGIRISELKFITVAAVKCGRTEISCKGKIRTVFLPNSLCKMLSLYIKEHKISHGSVFVTKSGNPLDRSNIWKLMKSLCDEAGVEKSKVFPHNLRHLFARTYYSLQKDIVRLADILGHSSIETTRIYTMESGEVHKSQIEKLGLLLC